MSISDWQAALSARGFDPGAIDGEWGPRTYAASMAALSAATGTAKAPPIAALLVEQPTATRPIREIIIHCTATPEGREVSVAEIREWHKNRGFNDIGYHYVVHLDGTVEAGRPEALSGAHVAGHNTGTLGVVYVGGTDARLNAKDTRTPAQKTALLALCRELIAKYPAITKIAGHNEYDRGKACPSFDVRKDPLGAVVAQEQAEAKAAIEKAEAKSSVAKADKA